MTTLPGRYVVGMQDEVIPAAMHLQMATRAGSTITRVSASHLAMVSRPSLVAHVIEEAATSNK